MKKIYLSRIFCLLLAGFTTFILDAQDPAYLLELRNDAEVSSTIYEFDIYLLRTGSVEFEYASGQYGITINPLIIGSGSISVSIVSDSSDPILVASGQNPESIGFNASDDVIMIAPKSPPGSGNGALISDVSPGTRICRIRITNTIDFLQYSPDLTWTTTLYYPTQVYAYVEGENTAITDHSNHTTSNLENPVLNLPTSTFDYKKDDTDMQVYPNPFDKKLFINYNLLNKSQVILSVFHTDGKLVEQLVNEEQEPDNYTVTWDAGLQSDGTYIVKLQTDLTQKVFKTILKH